jgi:hypothetical protein
MKISATQLLAWLLSCLFGGVGGYAYSRFHPANEPRPEVIRARRFELTDAKGRVIAFWGIDQGGNRVLAFLRTTTAPAGPEEFKLPAEQTPLTGQNPNEELAVGILSSEKPFVNLLGTDGKSRALLYLTEQQKPILNMADERNESRLGLGFISNDAPSPEDDDWALVFRTPNVAGIGSVKIAGDRKYRGYLSVDRNPKEK